MGMGHAVFEKSNNTFLTHSVVGQSRLFAAQGQAVRLPVAHMVCNQSPPVGDKVRTIMCAHQTNTPPRSMPHSHTQQPSLMTFREVETLAHEFGHALQHMLTTQDEGMVAGINGIEWDAVEVASQVFAVGVGWMNGMH